MPILALLAVVLLAPRLPLDWDLAGGQADDRARAVDDIRDSLLTALGGLAVVLGALLLGRRTRPRRSYGVWPIPIR